MPVQLDIAGNLAKGWALRESMSRAGEDRQDRNRNRYGQREALRIESGGTLTPEVNSFYDPYEFKLGEMFKGVFSGERRRERRDARALESSGMPTANQAMRYDYDRMQMADGGRVGVGRLDELERQQRRIEQSNAPKPQAKPMGRARRLANRAGRAAAPIALGATALDVAQTPTEQYRERFSMETDEPSFWGDVGVRALGAASDLGNAMTLGYAGRHYRDLQPNEEPKAAARGRPDVALALDENAPTEETTPTVTSPDGGGGAATPQSGAPFAGPPEPDQAAARLGNIDAMPDDMPAMGTRDWIAYREEMVPALMMQGMSASEAHQEVSAMQHQGFVRYGQQAAMMLGAGNVQGAARALKAAYQYFPNGADVKFGFQGDNLVAYATDEETGETSGTPQVITPEYLGSMMTNFQSPERFLAWTKDWRDEAFTRREYEEVTRPNAQNLMDYRNRSLDIAGQNAASNWLEAMTDMGGGGMTDSSLRAGDEAFRERVEMLGLEDEAAADELARVMSAIRRQIPVQRITDNEIINDVMGAYAAGNLDEIKARLGIR